MTENEPAPTGHPHAHNSEPTAADKHVYEVFASNVVDLVQLLDDYKTMMSPDVYERFFSSLLALSRLLGEYEDSWSQSQPTSRI